MFELSLGIAMVLSALFPFNWRVFKEYQSNHFIFSFIKEVTSVELIFSWKNPGDLMGLVVAVGLEP